MKRMKRMITLAVTALLLQGTPVYAQETLQSAWSLTQDLDMDECSYDDIVTLSVYGNEASSGTASVSEITAALEYDTDLFSVTADDITAAGSASSVEYSGGSVHISYASPETFTSGSLLFTADLTAINKDSSGKTTVCVTELTLVFSDGQTTEIANYNPSSILYDETIEWDDTETEEEETETETVTEKEPEKTVSAAKQETTTTVFKTGGGGQDRIFFAAGGGLLLAAAALFALRRLSR